MIVEMATEMTVTEGSKTSVIMNLKCSFLYFRSGRDGGRRGTGGGGGAGTESRNNERRNNDRRGDRRDRER